MPCMVLVYQVVGISAISFVIGSVSSIIGTSDRFNAKGLRHIEAAKLMLRQRKVTRAVKRRVVRYLEYSVWSTQGAEMDERSLLGELPFSLRLQV